MSDDVNACPDCGSVNRTMIQNAATGEVVWSCEHGHTWRDEKPSEPVVKPAPRGGQSDAKRSR